MKSGVNISKITRSGGAIGSIVLSTIITWEYLTNVVLTIMTKEVKESKGKGSILGTVLRSIESILAHVTRLLGILAPLPDEEGVEGDGVLESS